MTVKSNNGPDESQARAIVAVVQRHLPAVLADLRAQHAKSVPEVICGPCIFCGRVEKHVPGCMFQDDASDAKCVAELMERCLPDLLADQLPAALQQTVEGQRRERTVGAHAEKSTNPKPKQDQHNPRSHAIFRLVQLHMPAALATALPTALKRTLPTILPSVLATALPNILPTVLPAILPSILPPLFALPPSFTSSYDSSSFDDSPSPSPSGPSNRSPPNDYTLRPHDLTPLGATLLPHLLTHLRPLLTKMHARAMARGLHYWQKTAFWDLEEDAEGYKGELARLVDEGVEELRREAQRVVEGVREEVECVVDEVEEEACGRVEESVGRRGERAVEGVRRNMMDAMREAELRGNSEVRHRGGRRVGKGGYCGVGRRNEMLLRR